MSFRKSLSRFATTLKDYWFLVTLLMSAVASLCYMVLFQVTPLDTYREIKHQRDQVQFHNAVGYSFLEQGQYQLAKSEFDRSLALKATDYTALNGRYLSELFLDLQSREWDPAVGLAIKGHLEHLHVTKQRELGHIVEKYLGDLNSHVGRYDIAKRHYDNAISLRPNYVDALYTYGWFSYSAKHDVDNMERTFRKMCEIDSYDYRGFHGLTYALYMQAIVESDASRRAELLSEAVAQSTNAVFLSLNRLNVVTDFGEIARCLKPSLSILFHEQGIEILDDPLLSQTRDNLAGFGARLLTREGYVSLNRTEKKRAWVTYQLALDYLALARQGTDREKNLKEHARLKSKASQLDPLGPGTRASDIYDDQLAILNIFLPDNNPSPPP